MTLAEFMDTGGIPAEDAFCVHNNVWVQLFYPCLKEKDEAFLNRNRPGPLLTRLRRKLYFEYGCNVIPLDPGLVEHELLFWGGRYTDVDLKSVAGLFAGLSKKYARKGNPYTIVIGLSDHYFSDEQAALIPETVERVFAVNCNADHPGVHWLPIGRDPLNMDFFNIKPQADKSSLVYCNFSPATHPSRQVVLDSIKDKEFINFVHVEGYGAYSSYPKTQEEFLNELNMHQFAICPRGNGFDTYRLWDCLALGVIPIVVREAQFHRFMEELPILFLDSNEDYADLTEEFLLTEYDRMLNTKYHYDLLTTSYWKRVVSGEE